MQFVFQTDINNMNGIQNGNLHKLKFLTCDKICNLALPISRLVYSSSSHISSLQVPCFDQCAFSRHQLE